MSRRNHKVVTKKVTIPNLAMAKGHGPINFSLTTGSGIGAFVSDRGEVDSTLSLSLQQMGRTYVYWKILSMSFHFVPLKGANTDGNLGMCVLPDPLGTSPASTSTGDANEFSVYGPIHERMTLRYTPPLKKFLFTRDQGGTSDDRTDMFGVFVVWSENCTTAFIPGTIVIKYKCLFKSISNSSVIPAQKSTASVIRANYPIKNLGGRITWDYDAQRALKNKSTNNNNEPAEAKQVAQLVEVRKNTALCSMNGKPVEVDLGYGTHKELMGVIDLLEKTGKVYMYKLSIVDSEGVEADSALLAKFPGLAFRITEKQ